MNPWIGLFALLVALTFGALLRVFLRFPAARGHNVALDGLRGYLAFGVFLHHAVVWYFYLREGAWERPPLRAYAELGLTSVNFFFMITAFLFVGKVLDARERPIDWLQLYAARALRIVPLYLFALLALFALVGLASHGRLLEPVPQLAVHIGSWLSFGIAGGLPNLNAYPATGTLISFVIWTLAYEWLFYFSLPLIAIALGRRVAWWLVLLSTIIVVVIARQISDFFFPISFVAGAIAAALSRQPRIHLGLNSSVAALAALAAVAVLVAGILPHAVNMLLIFGTFLIVACGNGLFGFLSNRAAVELGEVSYGIYLLHGLVLSAVFLFFLTPAIARTLTPQANWAVVTGVGCLVVLVSTLTYRYLEKPLSSSTSQVVARIRGLLSRRTESSQQATDAP